MFQQTQRDRLITARADAWQAYDTAPFGSPESEQLHTAYLMAREAVREYDRAELRLKAVNQDAPPEWVAGTPDEPVPFEAFGTLHHHTLPDPVQDRPDDAEAPGGRP